MLSFYILISQIGSEGFTVGILLFIVLLLSEKNHKKDFYIILFTTIVAMLVTFSLKYLLQIPRPESMLIPTDGYRFPSGHATMASVVMCLGIYYSYTYIKNHYVRSIFCVGFIGWYFLVSYSRLYLQVHYPVDVVVGGIIGFLATTLVLRLVRRSFSSS